MAPVSASMSLKKGIAMARIVATNTNIVLQTSLNILILNFILPVLTGYSLVTKSEFGNLCAANVSTTRYRGWITTCPKMYSTSEINSLLFIKLTRRTKSSDQSNVK